MFKNAFKKALIAVRQLRYSGSQAYWERRYARGGNSGSGSSGELAAYKAAFLNQFLKENAVESVVELGCGDGQQLALADYPKYTGLDIAPSAIERCRRLFQTDPTKSFSVYSPADFDQKKHQADLALSLEVIFHLTENAVFETYLAHLFAISRRWVVIFSSDEMDSTGGIFPHFRPRHFLPNVPSGWILRHRSTDAPRHLTRSDFFVFEKEMA